MPRQLKVAVQMDPIESINIDADSTFALMLEARKRGHSLWHYEVRHMALREGVKRQGARREERLFARARPVTVQRVPGNHHTFGAPEQLDLGGMDVVLMRQDPPFDMAYITATHMLEHIQPKTLVVNDPAAVRNAPEKLLVTHFPELMPPTHDHLGPGGDPQFPAGAQRHHRQAAVRQRRSRGIPHQAGRREPGGAAGDALRPLAGAADVPALRTGGAPGRQAHHPGGRRADGRREPRAGRRARRAATCMWAAGGKVPR